jgi:hypothetical protein
MSGSSMSSSFQHHHVGALAFHRRDPGLADLHARLAPLQASLADRRRLDHGGNAVADETFIVELNPVCRLVLDAVPQRLELRAVQYRTTHRHLPALVRVLDLELARHPTQQLEDLRSLRLHLRRQRQIAVLDGAAQLVFDLARVASTRPVARRCSATTLESSKPKGLCVPSGCATETPANRCSGTTPN